MLEPSQTSLVVSAACTAVITGLSLPHLQSLAQRWRSSRAEYAVAGGVYEDKDGVASEESQEKFSDFVQRLSLILLSTIGFAIGLVSGVLTTSRQDRWLQIEQWLQFAAWAVLVTQSASVYLGLTPIIRYDLGVWLSLASLIQALAIPVEDFLLWQSGIYPSSSKIHVTFSTVQFFLALTLCFDSALLQRRPDVYLNGRVVDRQNTASLLGKYTFSWPTPILRYANKNRGLKTEDLPMVSDAVRAGSLQVRFDEVGKRSRLWVQILAAHKGAFIAQWLLQIVTAITNFLPQLVLYLILRLLEERDAGQDKQMQLWLAAAAVGIAVGGAAWLESLLFYTVFLKLAVPIYEQLSAVVFTKAMRKKDVKSVAVENAEDLTDGAVAVNKQAGSKGEDTVQAGGEDGDEEIAKSKQSTINLIGVDAKRIADFAAYSYLLLGSAVKLTVAVIFLVKLIGWIPMLCGLAAPLVITPVNWWLARHYSAAQDNLMKYRDQKLAVVNEALQGIRQIKFSALENDWYEKIMKTRRKELKQQWRVFCLDTGLISIWIFGPVCLSAIALASYAIIHGTLNASVAFTTISVFEGIEMTLAIIPEMITDLLDAIVSAHRFQDFLESAELEQNTIESKDITFQNATVSWPSDDAEKQEDRQFTMRNLNLEFKTGELNVVSGRTGSGKSLLLSAIIGEADILEGKVTAPRSPPQAERFDDKANPSNWILPGAIAYVSQIPWIENATLRDNILFGLPYEKTRYDKVLYACALEKDLEMLQDGDMTDIGANGINLSGGQKWRTSFARALYSRAGVLVLDDIFSAVDAHVGRHLYEEALTADICRGRTRILVTHHVALCLPGTHYSVLLENGQVEQAGATEELRKNGLLKDILAHDVQEQEKEERVAHNDELLTVDDGGHSLTKVDTHQSQRSRRESDVKVTKTLSRQKSHASVMTDSEALVRQKSQAKKFTEDEAREVGRIKFDIYKTYLKACRGYGYWVGVSTVFLSWIVVYLLRTYWVSSWTRQYKTEDQNHSTTITQRLSYQNPASQSHYLAYASNTFRNKLHVENDHGVFYYIAVYLIISLSAWIVGTIRYFTIYFASIRGSKVLFENLTKTILRTPLRFLDVTPVGRITNRFTADFNMVDSRLANDLGFMLHCSISVLSVFIAGFFVSPIMIIFAALLCVMSLYYASIYITGAREVKRLESTAKSPIFEQFSSVLTGIGTIRAFDKSSAYITRMFDKINTHCVCYWHMWLFNRWMGFRLDMVGAGFSLATAALVVSLKNVDASLAGFALSFTLQISESVIWALRCYANVELNFNAVERVVEYSNLEIEDQGGEDAPAAWPTTGRLEIENLTVSYAKDLSPVLKNLTFSVNSRERVGVVGRTGAGKSSLTLALFRFLEARSGSITLDGINISKIKLHDLRSRGLSIIPQDPVLFSGTVRNNLDPFDQHSDAELREALLRVHLINDNTSVTASGVATPQLQLNDSDTLPTASTPATHLPNAKITLSTRIAEGGLNLSQGQRQLLCLARAIVSRPRIMVLDEATSSVDMETDKLIQQSIREEFAESTLLVIAHRLSTIADFDRILVLAEGEVKEFDRPEALMKKEGGLFRDMVEKSGERSVLEGVIRDQSSSSA